MTHKYLDLTATLVAVTLSGMTALGQNQGKTTADGVYSAAQAERGAADYARRCARCHGDNLDGVGAAPMLYSSRFLDRWREDSLSTLFEYISRNMPADANAGSLSEGEYLDILTYLLSVNELPAGAAPLEAKSLAATFLVGPDGPKPLPPSTTVRVVGCLAQSGGAWSVVRSPGPARVRNGDTTDAAELGRSAQTPLGTQAFRLPTLSDDHQSAELGAQVARKVQVKGVLNGQGPDARVSVLSFEPLNQDCPK